MNDSSLNLAALREEMVERQLAARGITDQSVLRAMREVPREEFVSRELVEFAYEDAPLPIEEEQTISQPYIVAVMLQALKLSPKDIVLDVGTGSGYAAAVLSRIVKHVYTIERHEVLVKVARLRFQKLGYLNITVKHGDGTLGWLEQSPFNAIVVAAGGRDIPKPLINQLAIGGILVIPAGEMTREQKLLRVCKISDTKIEVASLGEVRFVPLIGAEGWEEVPRVRPLIDTLPLRVRHTAEKFSSIASANVDQLLDRIGDAKVVLLGEATHGTAEFYEMRARISRELIERKGFNIVAVEADWPDAARIDHFVRGTPIARTEDKPFSRFPKWMWANTQVLEFVHWLRQHNEKVSDPGKTAGFYGLDLYSLYTSINAVLEYLKSVDPETEQIARKRYGCLSPWEGDPAIYGAAVIRGQYKNCERDVVAMLQELLNKRMDFEKQDGERFLDVSQNARVIANAEKYYRIMYYGSRESWNHRDTHMFETLEAILAARGMDSRAIVWAHNSHLGDASATEMGARGEINVGQLCRQKFGDLAYLIGFGTDHGTVAAASDWNAPMEVKSLRPAHAESYERLCHATELESFLLPLRSYIDNQLKQDLMEQRLERAVGVVYRPETELASHYFYAVLPRQFDEYIWFDETHAVNQLGPDVREGMPETFPFGL